MIKKLALASVLVLLVTSQVYGRKIDAVVKIDTPGSSGSGVLVTPDGVILTAFHVIPSTPITVTYKGKQYSAVVRRKPHGDVPSVVSIKAEGKFDDYMGIASHPPNVGEKAWFAGYPSGKFSSTQTHISATQLVAGKQGSELWCIGVRDRALPGYSGGPLFDSHYNVTGICFASNLPPTTPGLMKNSSVVVKQAAGSNESWESVFFHTSYLLGAADTDTYEYLTQADAGKPTLTIFHSYTCAPCKRLVHEWNTDREFRQWLKDRFIVRWINTERLNPITGLPEPNPEATPLLKQFRVTAIPFTTIEVGNFFVGYTSDSKFKRDCEELLKYRPAPAPPKDLPVEKTVDDQKLDAPLPIEETKPPERWQTIKQKEAKPNPYIKPTEETEDVDTKSTTLPAQTAPERSPVGSAVPDKQQEDESGSEGSLLSGVGKTALLVGLGALTGGLPWYVPLGLRLGRRIFGSRGSPSGNPTETTRRTSEELTGEIRGSPGVSGSSTPEPDNPYKSLLEAERGQWTTERLRLVSQLEGLQTQVNELKNREQSVIYRELQPDDGLARMRRAQKLVTEEYPSKASTIRMIEQAYQLLLSGEGKLHA